MQTRRISEIIEVEEIFKIVEQGTTLPVKCRLKNGMDVIVKYMKNPWGQQVLLNEWLGSNIADIIGLTIPEYGICNLTKKVIVNTNENDEIDERNAGLAFYTKYYSKTIPVKQQRLILDSVCNKETEKLILFDHIVNNNDRHVGNLLCDISKGATLYTIDNSHIISLEPKVPFVYEEMIDDKEIISNRVLQSNSEIYDLLSRTTGFSENEMRLCALEAKSSLSMDVIEEIIESIPEEWVNSVGKDKTNRLFGVIKKRIAMLEEIAEMIIRERRTV